MFSLSAGRREHSKGVLLAGLVVKLATAMTFGKVSEAFEVKAVLVFTNPGIAEPIGKGR
jgi:hypothetical protein